MERIIPVTPKPRYLISAGCVIAMCALILMSVFLTVFEALPHLSVDAASNTSEPCVSTFKLGRHSEASVCRGNSTAYVLITVANGGNIVNNGTEIKGCALGVEDYFVLGQLYNHIYAEVNLIQSLN